MSVGFNSSANSFSWLEELHATGKEEEVEEKNAANTSSNGKKNCRCNKAYPVRKPCNSCFTRICCFTNTNSLIAICCKQTGKQLETTNRQNQVKPSTPTGKKENKTAVTSTPQTQPKQIRQLKSVRENKTVLGGTMCHSTQLEINNNIASLSPSYHVKNVAIDVSIIFLIIAIIVGIIFIIKRIKKKKMKSVKKKSEKMEMNAILEKLEERLKKIESNVESNVQVPVTTDKKT